MYLVVLVLVRQADLAVVVASGGSAIKIADLLSSRKTASCPIDNRTIIDPSAYVLKTLGRRLCVPYVWRLSSDDSLTYDDYAPRTFAMSANSQNNPLLLLFLLPAMVFILFA